MLCRSHGDTLLVLGVVDIRLMTLVAVAITTERLAPRGDQVARATGAAILVIGCLLIIRAIAL
jgi:predicted metal-binding membrane protein